MRSVAHVVFIAFFVVPQIQAQLVYVTLSDGSNQTLATVDPYSLQIAPQFQLASGAAPIFIDWVGDQLIGAHSSPRIPRQATITKLLEVDLVDRVAREISRVEAAPVERTSGNDGYLWTVGSVGTYSGYVDFVQVWRPYTGELVEEFEWNAGPISHYEGQMYSICGPSFCRVEEDGSVTPLAPAPIEDPLATYAVLNDMSFDTEGGLWLTATHIDLLGLTGEFEAWSSLHYTPNPFSGLDWVQGERLEEQTVFGVSAGTRSVEDIPITGRPAQALLALALAALGLAFLTLRS